MTTSSVSPTSASTIRCSCRGSSNGMATLARPPACIDAHHAERLRRLEHHVADDHGPGRVPSAPTLVKLRPVELELHHLALPRARDGRVADAAGRTAPRSCRCRSAPGCRTPARSCRRGGTSAAGVGTANGKVSRTDSPWRRTSTTTGAAGSAGSAGLRRAASRAPGWWRAARRARAAACAAALAAGAAGLGDDVGRLSAILAFSALAGFAERFGSAPGFCGDGCAFLCLRDRPARARSDLSASAFPARARAARRR